MKMFFERNGKRAITFVDRQDAENVLQQMKEVAAKYATVTVADVDELIGRWSESAFIDTYHGWWSDELPEKVEQVQTNIFHAPVYAIKLPKPRNLREEKPRNKWQKNARPMNGYLNDLYVKEAFEQIDKTPTKVEKLNYKFEEKSDDYEAGYRAGYKTCADDFIRKFEEMFAQMKKELEEAEA